VPTCIDLRRGVSFVLSHRAAEVEEFAKTTWLDDFRFIFDGVFGLSLRRLANYQY
jgi:hypothetical protein